MVIREYDEVVDKVTGKRAIVVYVSGPGFLWLNHLIIHMNLIGVMKVN
ncbi:hypothetical protein [Enterococcus cecorum]|nr:hypothetical protein [Enterococcus cecorum]MDZ5587934.1 hypothetical protein [Enterococcus cecorum]